MNDWVFGHDPVPRLLAGTLVFVVMAVWELLAPRRVATHRRYTRWPANLGIFAAGVISVRVLVPMLPVGAALWAETHRWGLLNLIAWPSGVEFVLAFVALDVAIYLQHRAFHAVPILWRVHRMHHADLEFDVTTGLRFHPFEIVLSTVWKLAVVTVVGAPVIAVLAFEVLLNAASQFNHGNVAIPRWLDAALRTLVVTPDMHRVHHSVEDDEQNRNFGFTLSWWDHLFGTYREAPRGGHTGMLLGVKGFRDTKELRLERLLVQPFRAASS